MAIFATKRKKQEFYLPPLREVRTEEHHLEEHFSRFDLELRELETQSREFQKLAIRLFNEGHLSTAKDILKRRDKISNRIEEVRDVLHKIGFN